MKKYIYLFFTIFMIVGCASSSDLNNKLLLTKGETIFIPENYKKHEKRHLGYIIRTLSKHGYKISRTRENANYVLDYSIKRFGVVSVKIGLQKNKHKILRIYSSSFNWKTLFSRQEATETQVKSAIMSLDRLLS